MQLTCINPYLETIHYVLTHLCCFNLTLLLQPHFDSLMVQISVNFSRQVNFKGVKAWDITLQNIKIIHRMYGVTNAQRRRALLQQFSQVLSRCNALLIHAPLDEELSPCDYTPFSFYSKRIVLHVGHVAHM